jgi:hypothetical protein
MLMSPLRRTGSQLGCSQLPGNGRFFPLLSEIVDSQVKLLCCRIVAGKVPSILEHFAYLHTQALDSVGRASGSPSSEPDRRPRTPDFLALSGRAATYCPASIGFEVLSRYRLRADRHKNGVELTRRFGFQHIFDFTIENDLDVELFDVSTLRPLPG